jgi:hypothetical protein
MQPAAARTDEPRRSDSHQRQRPVAAKRRIDLSNRNAIDAHFPFVELVRVLLKSEDGSDWTCSVDGMWCRVLPPGYRLRGQGWKLHLSATPLSAPTVLVRVGRVLLARRCAFKFAADSTGVAALTDSRCERSGAGKFIAVYPADDAELRDLAEVLHDCTYGLPGPAILSDRPVAPGSLVHYRFGSFSGSATLTNDGCFETKLTAPSGALVPDSRHAWFSPPEWVKDPLSPQDDLTEGGSSAPVLLGKRFVAHIALRHANRGGVYRAVDTQNQSEVILKHARRHVGGGLDGSDVRDLLRHEAEMLDRLAPRGIAPRKLALFEHDRDLFLAEETIEGVTLERRIAALTRYDRGPPLPSVLAIARALIGLATAITEEGLACCDFNPTNVMVTPQGDLRLIDLEALVEPGTPLVSMYSPGYGAPEQLRAAQVAPAPASTVTLFGLGATLFFVATGIHPTLATDVPAPRAVQERLSPWLAALGADNHAALALAPLILGLMADEPDRRWSLEQAQRFVDRIAATTVTAPRPRPVGASVEGEQLESDVLTHLVQSMTPDDPYRLWPALPGTESYDPCAVQHGAAGVLAVLTRAARVTTHAEVLPAIRTCATWIERRTHKVPRRLPGLYFGHSGIACALYEASRLLDDPQLEARARDLAESLPTRWPNPDVCHGAAGTGLAQLHFWAATGDDEFAERADLCAQGILAAAERRDERIVWPIPAEFDSGLAGVTHYGFAHGVAGIGTFLVLAGASLGRTQYLEAAGAAAGTLAAAAVIDDDAAWWSSGEAGETLPRLAHWCSGSSGIGTFLIRLWQATGDTALRTLAHQAATAVHRNRWNASTISCHGLAGDGDFLLDLAEITSEARYRAWADDLFTCLAARNVMRHQKVLIPDESGLDTTAGYGTGLAGILAFLMRLQCGGPRLWIPTPDEASQAVGRRESPRDMKGGDKP